MLQLLSTKIKLQVKIWLTRHMSSKIIQINKMQHLGTSEKNTINRTPCHLSKVMRLKEQLY